MAEPQPPPRSSPTPSAIPMKRTLEDDHAPSVSSPLNPDAKPRPTPAKTPAREQREKKDSLKKRESAGIVRGETPDKQPKKGKKATIDAPGGAPSPIRYNHALPHEVWHYTDKAPVLASHEPDPLFTPSGAELKRPTDHAENKKVYRYNHCVADPLFRHARYYRMSDDKPFGPRMSFEDSDKWFHFDDSGRVVTNEKGWRMGRANICVREGSFYYEVKILRGVQQESPQSHESSSSGPLPHIRMGWARREATLDTPIGFDGYSYGLTDIRMEPMHKSRASKFMDDGTDPVPSKKQKPKSKSKHQNAQPGFSANDHAREGDVIGLEINLPSLSLQRKIADGQYNPLVDTGAGLDMQTVNEEGALNIVRDRFPVAYKGTMYFETMECCPSKGMAGYGDRGPFTKETPDPNHEDPTLRNLPLSSIKVYKNGKMVGTAFRDLMAFLPPSSAPHMEKGVRAGMDDGLIGYYPAISAFSGGIAEVNFGPDFWYPPPALSSGSDGQADTAKDQNGTVEVKKEEDTAMTGMEAPPAPSAADGQTPRNKLRGAGERYGEMIAEDVLYDIIDEVDFWVQDGAPSDS